jgi:hypothetical protein
MRVILISFDALEYDCVEKYNCTTIKQVEYGKIDLTPYQDNRPRGRGSGDPFTPEVYATFITGTVPSEPYGDMYRKLDSKYPTIFQFAKNPLAVDVPAYTPTSDKAWMEKLCGNPLFSRYWEKEVSLAQVEREYYKWMKAKASFASLIDLLNFDLVLIYFKNTDHFHHIYNDMEKYGERVKKMYQFVEEITGEMIKTFDDGKTLIIIFSDHGSNLQGGHSHHGFWSSNIPLGRGNNIKVTDWYDIIKQWYGVNVEEMKVMKEKKEFSERDRETIKLLEALGYL